MDRKERKLRRREGEEEEREVKSDSHTIAA